MASFSTYADIEVDVDEMFCQMSTREKKEMLELLVDDLEVDDNVKRFIKGDRMSIGEEQHFDYCLKLAECYYRMSNEECKIVEDLAKKY